MDCCRYRTFIALLIAFLLLFTLGCGLTVALEPGLEPETLRPPGAPAPATFILPPELPASSISTGQ